MSKEYTIGFKLLAAICAVCFTVLVAIGKAHL